MGRKASVGALEIRLIASPCRESNKILRICSTACNLISIPTALFLLPRKGDVHHWYSADDVMSK